ncbi:hypothetical protein XA26_45790 [Mycolicibacterium fortuitum]|uniref:Uncharacterized protein n=1 Tax=Mycolicibacterium fortuitum TaxID=1766 RepID=A0A0N9XJU7_MYCFO|nr:hypothetical protein [Mycolicibacterium fortuitum]ALI28379.1 hypothetical protein XA26_45790 [Mycolicibacterium fortuitum]
MTNPEPAETNSEAAAPTTEAETSRARETRYRVERNTAREQLAAAEARITRYQRAEIERLARGSLSHADDLFTLSGNDVADYLTEAGDVDPDKVTADIEVILAERPGLQKPTPAPAAVDRSQGLGAIAETRPTDFSGMFSN